MDQLGSLIGNEGDDLRVRMTEGVDGDARGEVDEAAVVEVVEEGALAADEDGRWAGVGRDHVREVGGDEAAGFGGGGRVGIRKGGSILVMSEKPGNGERRMKGVPGPKGWLRRRG